MNYGELKDRQRKIRERFPTSLGLRVHRALSWLNRSEQESEDDDARFIFLWIAFNAAYANELDERGQFTEKKVFANFIDRLVDMDKGRLFYKIIWDEFSGSIRLLIDNQYIYQPFWDYHNGKINEQEWQDSFQRSHSAAIKALSNMDTEKVLMIIFGRLYTLRNQMMHGGATWDSGVNRDQLRDAANIMNKLVPIIIHIMMENERQIWGDPCYPVVK